MRRTRRASRSGSRPAPTRRKVAAAVELRTGKRPARLSPIRALVVDLPQGVTLAGIRGIRYVEPIAIAAAGLHAERSARRVASGT